MIHVTGDSTAYAVQATQSPGQIGPSFNVQFFPDKATADISWATFEPPPLSITMGEVKYQCIAQQKSVRIDIDNAGVEITAQYYPEILVHLKHTGPKKHIVYLSCQPHEYRVLKDHYDEKHYEVLYRNSDVYCSTGWTLNDILSDVGQRAGISLTSLLPTLHVPNSTIILQKGMTFLSFIQRLLPGRFRYIWTLSEAGLSVALAEKSGELSAPLNSVSLMINETAVPQYNFIEIIGGENSPKATLSAQIEGMGLDPPGRPRIITETLPSTKQGDDSVTITQTYLTTLDGTTMFALKNRKTVVTGPRTVNGGTATTTLRQTVETFKYENDDPLTFERPRQVSSEAVITQFYTKVAIGKVIAPSLSYFLTADGAIITPQDATEDDTIVLTAYEIFGESEKRKTSTKWVSAKNADANMPEGTEQATSETVTKRFVIVDKKNYDASLAPNEVLQQILAEINTRVDCTVKVGSVSLAWKDAEHQTRTLNVVGRGLSQLSRQQSILDPKSGNMISNQSVATLNGHPQGCPTVYATKPLRATLDRGSGSFGSGQESCIPLKFSIPTNNVTDFERWAAIALEQATNPERQLSFETMQMFYPPGMVIGGVHIESFAAAATDQGERQYQAGGR